MKSRTRSRSVATSGLGLKSIYVLSSGLGGQNASAIPVTSRLVRPYVRKTAKSAAAVAGEELALVLQQPGELQLGDRGQVALEDPRRVAAGQLRRDRQEELVDQAVRLQGAVERRAALAEQGPDPALLAQGAQ